MKLEIYFDYLCEFCERAHRDWVEVLPRHPGIEPVWMPCEAHPREAEPWGRHSDLAIQGMLCVRAGGGDSARYNDALFEAVYRRAEDIEDPGVLARCARTAGIDAMVFLRALEEHTCEGAQRANERRAWEELALTAVPTYILEDGRRLIATPGLGVSKSQLERFLAAAK